MRRLAYTAAIAALAALTAPAAAQTGAPPSSTTPAPPPPPPLKVQKPTKKQFIREGQTNRLLLGGTWYFRLDNARQGEAQHFFSQRSLVGWTRVGIPNDWNGSDATYNAQGLGWYRKEFKLPKAPRRHSWRWIVRFESVNARATVWLNGKVIGSGGPGYLPFELDLKGLRKGRNRLVVRVSNRRSSTDLTHWRPYGGGGWWNFGGISREIYVRPVDTVDIQDVAVTPRLRCVRCSARVRVHLVLRNLSRKKQKVALTLAVRDKHKAIPDPIELPARNLAGGSTREIDASFKIRKPRLWRPRRAYLYKLTASATVGRERRSSFLRYFGVRKIQRLSNGIVLLNGHPLRLRGAGIHEDDPATGAGLTPRQRSKVVQSLRSLGASMTESQYPLHPALLEAFDRHGILLWEQAPVYQPPNSLLDLRSVRAAGISAARRMVLRDRSHPSVLTWSLGNELAEDKSEAGAVGPGFARYVADGARAVRRLDKTRLVGLDRQSRLGEPTYHPAFNTLDALGLHDYFGWYRSASASLPPTTSAQFGPFLDGVHAAHPSTALFVTEFGAEATVHGPADERGTYEFQARFLRDHLAIQASRPFVNGSSIWILKDFRVIPHWTGGNTSSLATPPWNNKGLIEENGAYKPAFYTVREIFRRTRPLR